jgi:hypothetical protein
MPNSARPSVAMSHHHLHQTLLTASCSPGACFDGKAHGLPIPAEQINLRTVVWVIFVWDSKRNG